MNRARRKRSGGLNKPPPLATGRGEHPIATGRFRGYSVLIDDPKDGMVLRALKKIFARHVAEEAPSAGNGHAPEQPAAEALATVLPPPRPQVAPATADAIIGRFEPLLVHCPNNTKVLKTLAEAYARKNMFDKSLSFYQRALAIAGGKNADIEEAIEATTLKKFDLALSQIDPKAPDHADQSERMQNQRLEYQWHTMEEPPQEDRHHGAVSGTSPQERRS